MSLEVNLCLFVNDPAKSGFELSKIKNLSCQLQFFVKSFLSLRYRWPLGKDKGTHREINLK